MGHFGTEVTVVSMKKHRGEQITGTLATQRPQLRRQCGSLAAHLTKQLSIMKNKLHNESAVMGGSAGCLSVNHPSFTNHICGTCRRIRANESFLGGFGLHLQKSVFKHRILTFFLKDLTLILRLKS